MYSTARGLGHTLFVVAESQHQSYCKLCLSVDFLTVKMENDPQDKEISEDEQLEISESEGEEQATGNDAAVPDTEPADGPLGEDEEAGDLAEEDDDDEINQDDLDAALDEHDDVAPHEANDAAEEPEGAAEAEVEGEDEDEVEEVEEEEANEHHSEPEEDAPVESDTAAAQKLAEEDWPLQEDKGE